MTEQKDNDVQIGGTHYQTGGVQHWDLWGPQYLAGCATKYLARWRVKNESRELQIQDLRKARHYAQKLREVVGDAPTKRGSLYCAVSIDAARAWCDVAKLDWVERQVILKLMYWIDSIELDEAIAGIDYMLERASDAKSIREQRRVPRYDRAADDAAQHASLFPWQRDELPGDFLLRKFYKHAAPKVFRLEPFIVSHNLPHALRGCYVLSLQQNDTWILNLACLPQELRDFYPRLQMELNDKEHELSQQHFMYERDSQDGKYKLLKLFAADWGHET